MAYCPAVFVKLFLLLNVPEKVICPEPCCKIIQLNPSGSEPAAGNVNVMAAVHFKIIPLSEVVIVLLEASELVLETKPLNLEAAVFPPVKLPVVETFPVVKLISLPDFVQSLLILNQSGEAAVPVLTKKPIGASV
jgi:hypothetical protein